MQASSKNVYTGPIKPTLVGMIKEDTISPNLVTPSFAKELSAWLDEWKAENIVTIDLTGKSDIADIMIIASGMSAKHASALADKMAQKLKSLHYEILSIEGQREGNWILIDLGDIIIHLFKPEIRELYNLEKMWAIPAVTDS